jgi:hypothetical protein
MTPSKTQEEILKKLGYEYYEDGVIYYRDEKGVMQIKTEFSAYELLQAIQKAQTETAQKKDEYWFNECNRTNIVNFNMGVECGRKDKDEEWRGKIKEELDWLDVFSIHILHNNCPICNEKIEDKIKELKNILSLSEKGNHNGQSSFTEGRNSRALPLNAPQEIFSNNDLMKTDEPKESCE